MARKSIAQPTIIGEVLWDCFPDRRVLGGAPFNVAWNLAGFGLDPLMVSAVGDDDLGSEILQGMKAWGMSTEAIQVSDRYQTGRVNVTVEDGEPEYDIVTDVAYDHIAFDPAIAAKLTTPDRSAPDRSAAPDTSSNLDSASRPAPTVLYHGSLAYRNEATRSTIQKFREQSSALVFVDINIREPHFDFGWVEAMLSGADTVKLNIAELARITGHSVASEDLRRSAAHELLQRYSINQAFLTLGADGAELVDQQNQAVFVAAPQPERMVDAVGAGDAFASVVLHGKLTGREPRACLEDAVEFAASVCGLSGATTHDRKFYDRPFVSRTPRDA